VRLATTSAQRSIGLCVDVEPSRHALYRSLLPSRVRMPSQPRVQVYLTDIVRNRSLGPYMELGACLACEGPAGPGWVVAEMLVDGVRARWGGVVMGYPKVMARMALARDGEAWSGLVERGGETWLSASWSPADLEVPWAAEVRLEDPFYLFVGPVANVMEFSPAPGTSLTRTPGVARVAFGASRPWTALLPQGELELPAFLSVMDGPGVLTRRSAA
jgi:hypothetical protein